MHLNASIKTRNIRILLNTIKEQWRMTDSDFEK